VGKSNILEAISLYSPFEPEDGFLSLLRYDGNATLFFNGNIEQPFEVILNKHHGLFGEFIKDFLRVHYYHDTSRAFGSGNNLYSTSGEKIFTYEIHKSGHSLPYAGALSPDMALPSILRYEFDKKTQFRDGDPGHLNAPFGANVFDVLSSHEELRNSVSELFKRYDLRFALDKSTRSLKILKDVGNNDIFLISYAMIADTIQRLIFYKAAIYSNKKSILIFEEPEAHMFPPYIKKFTTEAIFDRNQNQYFIATHSPYVLDSFVEDAYEDTAVFLVDYVDGKTVVFRLEEKDQEEIRKFGVDLFYNLESYLDKRRDQYGKVDSH
jgi:hypothetical protein